MLTKQMLAKKEDWKVHRLFIESSMPEGRKVVKFDCWFNSNYVVA